MEIDDLKNDWEAMTNQTEKQNNLTPKIINQMTQKKYFSMINKIKFPEYIGGLICLLGAGFIGFKFSELDTIYLQIVVIIAISLLILMPTISLLSFSRFNLMSDVNKPYAETLRQFAVQELRFQKFQQANAFFSYLLLVTIIILLPKFFKGTDISTSKYFGFSHFLLDIYF